MRTPKRSFKCQFCPADWTTGQGRSAHERLTHPREWAAVHKSPRRKTVQSEPAPINQVAEQDSALASPQNHVELALTLLDKQISDTREQVETLEHLKSLMPLLEEQRADLVKAKHSLSQVPTTALSEPQPANGALVQTRRRAVSA